MALNIATRIKKQLQLNKEKNADLSGKKRGEREKKTMKINQEFIGTIINVTETPYKDNDGKERISYKAIVATKEDAGPLPCSDDAVKLLKTYIGHEVVLETVNDSTSKCYTPVRITNVRDLPTNQTSSPVQSPSAKK